MTENEKPRRPKDSPADIALQREASMASMAIGVGLTHMRRYDSTQSGFFYSGLSLITAGLERLLKLILIYDYRLQNAGAFPSNNRIRAHGHNIDVLIKEAKDIARRHGLDSCVAELESDIIYQTITENLTDYAQIARYYNLDYLSGRQQAGTEPLARWDAEVCSIIANRHYHPGPKKLASLRELGAAADDLPFLVWSMTEDATPVETFTDMLLHHDAARVKQKYSMYYLYVLIRALCVLLTQLELKGNFYPFLREFFVVFRNPDRAYILRKRSWNPYPPYYF